MRGLLLPGSTSLFYFKTRIPSWLCVLTRCNHNVPSLCQYNIKKNYIWFISSHFLLQATSVSIFWSLFLPCGTIRQCNHECISLKMLPQTSQIVMLLFSGFYRSWCLFSSSQVYNSTIKCRTTVVRSGLWLNIQKQQTTLGRLLCMTNWFESIWITIFKGKNVWNLYIWL